MKLKVKDVNLSSGGPLVVVVHKEDAEKLDLHPTDRVMLARERKKTAAVVDISEDKGLKPGEIGLFEEVLKKLNVKKNQLIDVELEEKPMSIGYIKKKLNGKELSNSEIDQIVADIVDNKLSDIETSFFVGACYMHGLKNEEVVSLSKAIVNSGTSLKFDKEIIVDKHSSSGTAGNRTSMLIVPIVAAAGLTMPKTSSRAITSAAGTADVMEVLANVSFTSSKIKEIVEKTNGCIVWSGALDLASADDRIIKMEYPLSLDPEGLLLSSILAKKKAVGATHVLIDIPYGKGAKIEDVKRAKKLKKKFIKLGRKLGMNVLVILTEGGQPIGNGIGPALEARDVLWVLTNNEKAPKDLKKKSVMMAGLILKMAGKGDENTALELLESGKAYEKMKEIIKAQGGDPGVKPGELKIGKFSYVVRAQKDGKIYNLDNKAIAKIARIAGAPRDKGAGVYLEKHRGDNVRKGNPILTVYAKSGKRLNYTLEVFKRVKILEIK